MKKHSMVQCSVVWEYRKGHRWVMKFGDWHHAMQHVKTLCLVEVVRDAAVEGLSKLIQLR